MIYQRFSSLNFHHLLQECTILKNGLNVEFRFFDFGVDLPLWCLLPKARKVVLCRAIFRQNFIDLHNGILTKNGQNFRI